MPLPFSHDLRLRIVHACQAGALTQAEIAELFQVHPKTVEKYWRQWRDTGSVAPRPHAGGTPGLLAGHENAVRALVATHPDATSAELAALLAREHGVRASTPVVWRCVVRLGLPRKKRR